MAGEVVALKRCLLDVECACGPAIGRPDVKSLTLDEQIGSVGEKKS